MGPTKQAEVVISPVCESESKLRIFVIFTDPAATSIALASARRMARDLEATLMLLAGQVVPYPVPLDEPLVSREFTERALSRLAADSDLSTMVTVLLCRDRNDALRAELRPESLVVIGSARRWMPRRDASLIKLLRRDGHSVFIASQRAVPVPSLPKLAVAMESRR